MSTLTPKQKKTPKIADKYLAFCNIHKFDPKLVSLTLLILLTIIILLLCSISNVTLYKSRPVQFGMEDIGELATQVGYYTNVQVISSSREVFGVDIPFTQNQYIFSYDGTIKAGIDFSKVDISLNHNAKSIEVILPEVKILSNEIDEESLEIYDEQKNIFNPLHLDDIKLSFITLKEESEKSSIENGLLENARDNAELLIRGFLQSTYDLSEYSITFIHK